MSPSPGPVPGLFSLIEVREHMRFCDFVAESLGYRSWGVDKTLGVAVPLWLARN